MRNIKVLAVVLMVLAMAFSVYAEGMKCKGMKGGGMGSDKCKMMDMSNCPFCVKGSELKVVNTADGIQITVISKDKTAVKEIQEKGAKFTAMCANMGAMDNKAAKNPEVIESKMDGKPDDVVTCPVTGETLKKKDAYAVYEYKGKKYYMCCDMCPKPFMTNPEKYVK